MYFTFESRPIAGLLCILLISFSLFCPGHTFAQSEFVNIQRLMIEAYENYTGTGKVLDYGKALKLYKKAAELGDVEAQFIVGGMYFRGLGTEVNIREAFDYLLKAAKRGKYSPKSLAIIGSMYVRGTVIPQNYVESRRWYSIAAEMGNMQAQSELAYMLYHGLGGDRDFKLAEKLFHLAAMQGDIQAQYNIGLMYATGTGVDVDLIKGYAWYSLAASQGNTSAVIARNDLLIDMNWDELNVAQALSVQLYSKIEKNKMVVDELVE